MKRVICSLLVVMLVLCSIPICGNAAEREQEIIRFEDGSYAVVETITSGARASGRISGSRPYTYYDSTGVAQWKVVLNGSFTYTGSSATCTSASCSVTIYNSEWYTVSKNASKSGNTASANATMGESSGGVLVNRVSASLTLRCDKNGNLS